MQCDDPITHAKDRLLRKLQRHVLSQNQRKDVNETGQLGHAIAYLLCQKGTGRICVTSH